MSSTRLLIRCGVVSLLCFAASCGDDGGSGKKDASGTGGGGGSAGKRLDGSVGGGREDGSIGGAPGDASVPDARASDAGISDARMSDAQATDARASDARLSLDGIAPPAMLTATVVNRREALFELVWTAPSDNGARVAGYQIRYAKVPITTANFDDTTVTRVATYTGGIPASPGDTDGMTVKLYIATGYYFAVTGTDSTGAHVGAFMQTTTAVQAPFNVTLIGSPSGTNQSFGIRWTDRATSTETESRTSWLERSAITTPISILAVPTSRRRRRPSFSREPTSASGLW